MGNSKTAGRFRMDCAAGLLSKSPNVEAPPELPKADPEKASLSPDWAPRLSLMVERKPSNTGDDAPEFPILAAVVPPKLMLAATLACSNPDEKPI